MDQSKIAFLQSVLRYSTTHTETGPTGTATSSEAPSTDGPAPREMSPERRKWLEEALSTMSINPIDEIKKCMKVLQDDQETPERRVEALETLRDWCEDLNFAIDFHKLDGYKLLPVLLNDSNEELRALTCELIGCCAQNNPYCQQTLLDAKILPLVLQKLDKDADNVKIKAMFAISCIARDFEPGQQKLLEGNAFDILVKAIRSPVEKLQIKCCFLFSSICNNKDIKGKLDRFFPNPISTDQLVYIFFNRLFLDQLTNRNLIKTLIDMYSFPDSNIHEHILSAINVLIDENPKAIKQAKEMKDLNFKQILSQRIELIGNDPRFQEEKEMVTKIYENLFQN